MNEMENKTAKVIAESIESKRERKKKQKEVISVERHDRNNAIDAMKNSHLPILVVVGLCNRTNMYHHHQSVCKRKKSQEK